MKGREARRSREEESAAEESVEEQEQHRAAWSSRAAPLPIFPYLSGRGHLSGAESREVGVTAREGVAFQCSRVEPHSFSHEVLDGFPRTKVQAQSLAAASKAGRLPSAELPY